jgi:hypothetical protein
MLAFTGFLYAFAWALVPLPMMHWSVRSYVEWLGFLVPVAAGVALFPKGKSKLWEQPFTLFCGVASFLAILFIVLSASNNWTHRS